MCGGRDLSIRVFLRIVEESEENTDETFTDRY